LSEPDVTLTDYGLAVECAVCAAFLARTPTGRNGLRTAGSCFFLFLGLSAATGGTVHGFCAGLRTAECRLLWQLTLESLGLVAFSTWVLGAGVLARGHTGRWLAFAAVPQVALYQHRRSLRHAAVLDRFRDLSSGGFLVAGWLLPRLLARRESILSRRSLGLGIVSGLFLDPVHEDWR
jgi:hypothetical protein